MSLSLVIAKLLKPFSVLSTNKSLPSSSTTATSIKNAPVIAENGLGMQDEFAEPEIESGQLPWLSEIVISNFAYCILQPTMGQISPEANIFIDWLRAQDF